MKAITEMKSVGNKLRAEREQRGIDLAKLADLTCISRRYLEAIENGNVDALPSGFFYRSFVRQYADALGIDTDEIDNDLERARAAEEPVLSSALEPSKFPIKMPDPIVTESNRRYLGTGRTWAYVVLLVTVLIGCSAFYAWWRNMETVAAGQQPDTVTEAAQPVQTPAAESAAATTASPDATSPAPASGPPAPASSAASGNTPAPAATDPAAMTAPVTKPPQPAGVPAVTSDDRVVVQLAATESTWVSATADGKTVFSGLLQPNQSVTVGSRERTKLRIGNAGGLTVSWNGKTLGAVGPKGQVRSMLLMPDSYQLIPPVGSL